MPALHLEDPQLYVGQGGLSITLNFTVPGSPPSGEAFDKTKLWKFKCPAAL